MPYIIHTKDQKLSMGVTPSAARKSMRTKGDPFYRNPSAYEKELKSAKTKYVSKRKLANFIKENPPDPLDFGWNDWFDSIALSEAKKNRRRRIGRRNSKRR